MVLNAQENSDETRLRKSGENVVADERIRPQVYVKPDIEMPPDNFFRKTEDALVISSAAPKTAVIEDEKRLPHFPVEVFNFIDHKQWVANRKRRC